MINTESHAALIFVPKAHIVQIGDGVYNIILKPLIDSFSV